MTDSEPSGHIWTGSLGKQQPKELQQNEIHFEILTFGGTFHGKILILPFLTLKDLQILSWQENEFLEWAKEEFGW